MALMAIYKLSIRIGGCPKYNHECYSPYYTDILDYFFKYNRDRLSLKIDQLSANELLMLKGCVEQATYLARNLSEIKTSILNCRFGSRDLVSDAGIHDQWIDETIMYGLREPNRQNYSSMPVACSYFIPPTWTNHPLAAPPINAMEESKSILARYRDGRSRIFYPELEDELEPDF
jgi:hypothetical protein